MIAFITLTMAYVFGSIEPQSVIPNLSGKCYLDLRDLNIGINVYVSARGDGNMYCLPQLDPRLWRVQNTEAMKYSFMEINNNKDILPNISLGYVMVDGCNRDIVSLARTLSFIPDRNMSVWNPDNSGGPVVEDCGKYIKKYPVVGMIGHRQAGQQ